MRKISISALAFFAFCGQAHAATKIILNSENTALPSYTTAQIFQDFGTNIPNGTVFVPNTTIKSVINSGTPTEFLKNPNKNDPTVVRKNALEGMSGDYLAIGNGGRYTLDFAKPIAFFSFAFNDIDNNNHLKFTYADHTTQVLNGLAILGNPSDDPDFGRVSFDVGSGSKIQSVSFYTGDDSFNIDSIASAAPEPSTWMLMIVGFGIVGFALRKRTAVKSSGVYA